MKHHNILISSLAYDMYTSNNWITVKSIFSHACSNSDCVCSSINELKNLQFLPRTKESREVMVEDRTRAHADHVGYGFDRATTAAVGLLKAVHSPDEL